MPVPYTRAATPDDEDALGRLDRVTWSTLHSVQERPRQPYVPFFNECYGPRDHLVAELDGTVVGYARLALPSSLACHAHVRQIQGLVAACQGVSRRCRMSSIA